MTWVQVVNNRNIQAQGLHEIVCGSQIVQNDTQGMGSEILVLRARSARCFLHAGDATGFRLAPTFVTGERQDTFHGEGVHAFAAPFSNFSIAARFFR